MTNTTTTEATTTNDDKVNDERNRSHCGQKIPARGVLLKTIK